MIININNMTPIKYMPHKKDFTAYRKLLTDCEYTEICDEINRRIEGNEVNTSSWIPGNEWDGTPFASLSRVCKGNKKMSGLLFGLLVFKVFMDRDDYWGFGRYKKGDIDINGMTYFLLNNVDLKSIKSK